MEELQRWNELARVGHTHRDLAQLMATGVLDRVRPGVYGEPAVLDELAAYRRLIYATARVLKVPAVVSHYSAAVLHGLPVPANGLHKVWLTRPGSHGKSSSWIHLCRAGLDAADVVQIDGLAVTSVERTAADLARRMSFVDGVSLMDAVLHRAHTDEEATPDLDRLTSLVQLETQRRGAGRAREVLDFADGRAESVGESRSRVALWQHGLSTPELQKSLYDEDGFIGTVDFWWEKQQVIGEFDGKVKYGRSLAPNGDPGEAAWREKIREDRLRRSGPTVVRWIWDDLMRPYQLARRLRAALERPR